MTQAEADRRFLERAHQYAGESVVTVEAWPSGGDRELTPGERRAVFDEWLEFFTRPSSITDLTLWCRVNDSLLAALRKQTQLQRLTLKWGPYTDLSPLTGLRNLEVLSLGGASALTDLTPLSALDGLASLEIENGRRLIDYSPLGRITSLQELTVGRSISGGRTRAESLEFLADLPDLRRLFWDPRVESLDYSPVLRLTDADDVWVTPTRGMVPAMADLEWALPGLQAHQERIAAQRIPIESMTTGTVSVMTRDVTGRVVFVEPDDGEDFDFELDVQDAQFVSGWISGTTLRIMARTAKTIIERFKISIDGIEHEHGLVVGPAERQIGQYSFSGPAEGPILVWDAPLKIAEADDSLSSVFDGNLDVLSAPPHASVTLDASAHPPLPDKEFWPLIDALEGKVGTMSATKLGIELARRDDEFILRWAQSLGVLAVALNPTITELEQSGAVPPRQRDQAIGAIIGRGQSVYERVTRTPSAFDPRWLRSGSGELLGAASAAMNRRRPEVAAVTTVFARAGDRLFGPGDAGQSSIMGFVDIRLLQSARALVRIGRAVHERVVIFDPTHLDGSQHAAAARIAVSSFGGEILEGPEISAFGVGSLAHLSTVFVTRRRSGLSDAGYLARHGIGNGSQTG